MAKNQITTVDIGTNSVKVLQLELTQTGIVIVNFGMESYPRQSATERISDEVVIDILNRLIRDRIFKTKPVAMAMPRHFVTVKGLAGLPASATDEDIGKMVPIQVESELPFAIEDAVYSAYNFQRSPESISLEVVAAKRTAVDRYVDIAERTGLKLKAIIPSAFATYGVAFDQFKEQLVGKTLAVADIGAGMTDVCIIQHGRLVFSRSFAFGGNLLTEQFEREYGLSFAAAEERKISRADLKSTVEDPVTRRWAENLAMQITRSFRAFTGEDATYDIDSLWLCGGGSLVPGLADYLAARLGMEVSPWNPLQGIGGSVGASTHPLTHLPTYSLTHSLSVALGLGIIGLAGEKRAPTVNANLLPKEISEREERARRKLMVSVATVLAVLILAGAGLGVGNWRRSRAALYEKVASELQELEKQTGDAKTVLENSILMQGMMTPYITPLEVLREMSESLPDRRKIALTSLNIDKKGRVTMGVEAASYADVSEMIQILSETKLLGDAKLFDEVKHGVISRVTKEKRPILQVQIACVLNQSAMQGME